MEQRRLAFSCYAIQIHVVEQFCSEELFINSGLQIAKNWREIVSAGDISISPSNSRFFHSLSSSHILPLPWHTAYAYLPLETEINSMKLASRPKSKQNLVFAGIYSTFHLIFMRELWFCMIAHWKQLYVWNQKLTNGDSSVHLNRTLSEFRLHNMCSFVRRLPLQP